jgi:hypothetical protein
MYLERKRLENSPTGKYRYSYLTECPNCTRQRWTSNAKATRCSPCAGRETYTPSKVERKDVRKRGQGYITKQGYHLMYDGKKYVPAHRLAFPGLDSDIVVHHIDGDKLNNAVDNLLPLSKKEHRKVHGQLEHIGYFLIQSGFIEFDKETNTYNLSSLAQKCEGLISVNSGEVLTGSAEDNPEPSPDWGRCNDYPIEEYAQVGGSAEPLNE